MKLLFSPALLSVLMILAMKSRVVLKLSFIAAEPSITKCISLGSTSQLVVVSVEVLVTVEVAVEVVTHLSSSLILVLPPSLQTPLALLQPQRGAARMQSRPHKSSPHSAVLASMLETDVVCVVVVVVADDVAVVVVGVVNGQNMSYPKQQRRSGSAVVEFGLILIARS